MISKSDRARAHIAFNEIPKNYWVSFGDIVQKVCLSPKKVQVLLREAKQAGIFEFQQSRQPSGYNSTIWNGMYKRVKDVDVAP